MTKYKFWSIMLTVTMAVAIVFVSCSPTNIASDEDNIQVYFGSLQAKAIDETAYTSSGSATFGTANVQVGDTNAYYWSYAAVKADDYFTTGKTYAKGETPVFVDCAEGTGLGSTRTFSKGAWTFTLRAYASAADRTAGTQYIFEGSTTTESMTASQAVAIPVSYSYVAGTGTASFTISTSITQPEVGGVSETYEVTKVEAIIGDTTKELSTSDNGATWKGTQSIASGIQTVGLKVYVADETTARASNESLGTSIILHGMTTEITGSATVTLTGADLSVSFTSSTPSEQPTEDGFDSDDDSGAAIDYSLYSVGSTGPAGGKIIYKADTLQTSKYVDTTTGQEVTYTWQCLEMAPADASSSAVFGYYRPGGTNTVAVSEDTTNDTDGNSAIGQGRYNTTMLVYKMGKEAYSSSSGTDTTSTYAAKLCDDYSVNGYDDWFLPSIQELQKGSSYLSGNTWSSSEYSASYAWRYYYFYGGLANYDNRYDTNYVRAVRAF